MSKDKDFPHSHLKETIPVTVNKFDQKTTDLVSDHFEELLA